MEEFLKLLVDGIMDAIEEFFTALTIPSTKFTFNAFLISLTFLGWSILASVFGLFSFVSWQEALTCSIILALIVLIDSTTRSSIKDGLMKVKNAAKNLTYSGETIEECEMEVIDDEPRC